MLDTKALRSMSYGVYIITAKDEDVQGGCVVNTLTQVTSKPARVSVAINKENFTTGLVLSSGRFEASVLAESAPMELIGRFGFHTGADIDKFAETEHGFDEAGVPYVSEHAVSRLGVRVLSAEDVGTHMLIVGEVEEAERLSSETPMTYAYYHQVKGGKTPPKASSYEAPESASGSGAAGAAEANPVDDRAEKAVSANGFAEEPAPSSPAPRIGWKCQVCGYVIEVDELPEDFVCPVCGVGRENFVRIEL